MHYCTSGAVWILEKYQFFVLAHFLPRNVQLPTFLPIFQLILHFPWLSWQNQIPGQFPVSLMIRNPDCQKIRLVITIQFDITVNVQCCILASTALTIQCHLQIVDQGMLNCSQSCCRVTLHTGTSKHYQYRLVKTDKHQPLFIHFQMINNWLKLV